MTEAKPWYEEVVFPALLRHARYTYGVAMRDALAESGFDDIPRNGLYVIGGLAMGAGGVPLGQLIKELRISKQAAGQLVDALVLRGYLARLPDANDRRKLTISLTERGREAAAIQAGAREKIDAELAARVGEEGIRQARHALGALIDIGRTTEPAEDEH